MNGGAKPGWAPARKFGFEDNRFMMNRGHYKLIEGEYGNYEISYKGKRLRKDNYFTDFLTRQNLKFISEHKSEPFCCVLAFPAPHDPNIVRPPYDTMYKDFKFQMPASASRSQTDLPSWTRGGEKMKNMFRYFGMVKYIDDNIGIIINELKKQGLLDKTFIIFTSDHDDLCG